MRAAEGGQEIVERLLVGDVDGGQLQAPFVFVVMEHVVFAHADVEQVSRGDARGVVVVVFRAWGGESDQRGAIARVAGGERTSQGGTLPAAEEAGLQLLVGG